MNLSTKEKKYLLDQARQVIENKLKGLDQPGEDHFSDTLQEQRGIFVTLIKSNQLRGCIGYVEGIKPLYIAVEEMALAAAFDDHVTTGYALGM